MTPTSDSESDTRKNSSKGKKTLVIVAVLVAMLAVGIDPAEEPDAEAGNDPG